MPTPFPSMDPYLEQANLWPQVHTALVVSLQWYLMPLLRPQYHVAIEQRPIYQSLRRPIRLAARMHLFWPLTLARLSLVIT